ncbi:hypothetical protein PSECIP111951_00681 [Pseudoalteromonas holothuriae]|uniref:EF-hand domain-containing protein n=2 Tax=Pseudoalteromonas holothuriae TaxID=2963714 RepID=A0ABN8UHE1_9GAMM|nr:hypothetical protein PSECIP111951_00681 [Pseudoalteromonas sp. CIP111951]
MFKKTLLALAVAGTSLSATAGSITANITEKAPAAAATTIAGVVGTAAFNGCALAATALKVTVNNNGNVPNNAAVNDNMAVTNTNGVFDATSSVTMTGTDTCNVVIAETLVGAATAKYSQEAATAVGVTVTAKQVAGIGGFKAEDTIIFTFAGVEIDEAKSASATLTDGQGNVIPLINVVNNTLIFSFPSPYNGSRAKDILSLAGVTVKGTATKVTVSSETRNTSNIVVDNSAAATVVEVAKQYSSKVEVKGDAIIDVQKERLEFAVNTKDSADAALNLVNAGESVLNDTLVVENTVAAPTGKLVPTTGSMVVKGNFAWMKDLDTNKDGTYTSAELAAGLTFASYDTKSVGAPVGQLSLATAANADTIDATKIALNTAMTELTVPYASFGANNEIEKYHAVTFKVKGVAAKATTAIAESTYTASINLADANKVALNVATDAEVAKWTLNGSVVNVPYIPFGPNTQPIIRHTNKGVQTGDISLRYMVEGSSGNTETNTWKSLGVIVDDAKPGVRNLLDIVTEKLTAELGTDKFKVALEITTNVPKEDVTVFAAAKITAEGQDRLTIGAFESK